MTQETGPEAFKRIADAQRPARETPYATAIRKGDSGLISADVFGEDEGDELILASPKPYIRGSENDPAARAEAAAQQLLDKEAHRNGVNDRRVD